MSKRISIIGLGWLGEALATKLYQAGHEIIGSTTSIDKLLLLARHPFYTGRLQLNCDEIIGDWAVFMKNVDLLIINFPPKRIDDIAEVYPQQIEQIVQRTNPNISVIFISSTAVYANENRRITEDDPARPSKLSGKAVLAAENKLRKHFGANLTILRLAGLIGPERHPGRFLANKRALKNPDVPINLIHRTDVIALIQRIIDLNCFGELINGCADEHPIRKAYYTKAAQQLELPSPIFGETDTKTYKIIDNSKSKRLLNFDYQYANPELIFEEKQLGEIAIIGAGPGDPSLLTRKAYKLLQSAEVILHDNLVSNEILALNAKAELIYVGRKYGDQSNQKERQDKINQLLAQSYHQGKKVVRLKSGDPYIYGRAAEEARFLKGLQIPFSVVPGISAALAAANQHNIPLTERSQSNAVLICTAHTADYSFEQLKGIAELLKAGNALALYMGLRSLNKLIPKLLEVCGDPTIPINAISNVSRTNETLLQSTLETIEIDVKKSALEMPVVFIVGVKKIEQR
ncbi:uroporphyrinogen-III C-methyltransferase [Aureispira anguillae]|uniref:uroporphyrinogen-III C-methyltransferase n=1 Tax=Aureispira anguillae TaxID=2864201 RepID=A0A915YDP3_9BACT|nr:uroporphyrinogen-III C-methyltransferase [Aureispira anguillae]BDS11207.1 uroporphyrinogen-III C-methyltransferase [Aureispira anguillae]